MTSRARCLTALLLAWSQAAAAAGGRAAVPSGAPAAAVPVSAALALPAASAAGSLALIQDLRRAAKLPELSAEEAAAFAAAPPRAQARARVQAAQALLSGVSPHFSAAPARLSRAGDSAELAELRRLAGAAREILLEARVNSLRDDVSRDGAVDPAALERFFSGAARLAAVARTLPGAGRAAELAADGAPRQALAALARLKASDPSLRRGPRRAVVKALARQLRSAPEAPFVADFRRAVEDARRLFTRREYGLAFGAARRLLAAASTAGIRDATRSALGNEAFELLDAVRVRGAERLYGKGGAGASAKLAERVAALRPENYVGAPLPRGPIRVQCHGDCAVQQAYNHPALAALAEQMPYATFLRAVEGKIGPKVRDEGLMNIESSFVLKELGLARVDQGAPRTAEELAALLRRRGALLGDLRWNPPEDDRDVGGNHAVVLQGAFFEGGRWNFVLVDSNHAKPQVFTFDELGVFGLTRFDSVEPLPEARLPQRLRAVADPAERLRRAVRDFYGRYAAVRAYVPWYARLAYAPLNFVRERLGWEPLDPPERVSVDENLVSPAEAPARLRAAVRRGLALPPETVVAAPDGRRFWNRLLVERALASLP